MAESPLKPVPLGRVYGDRGRCSLNGRETPDPVRNLPARANDVGFGRWNRFCRLSQAVPTSLKTRPTGHCCIRVASFIFLVLLSSASLAQVRPLNLVPAGEPRTLLERILGASAEPFWDDFIHDPAKVAAIKSLHLASMRFPGGSQSNYYDWKRGLFFVPAGANHSPYYELFVRLSSFVPRKFPEGFSLEQYKAFSDSIDAEVVMVPNLETASVEDQVEWFKHLSAKGAVPTHIELGNEFWVAMGQDPVVLRRLAGRANCHAGHEAVSRCLPGLPSQGREGRRAGCRPFVPRRALQPRPDDQAAPSVERRSQARTMVRCRDDPSLSETQRGRGTRRRQKKPSRPRSPCGTCGR